MVVLGTRQDDEIGVPAPERIHIPKRNLFYGLQPLKSEN
jgi:hypothetical protein